MNRFPLTLPLLASCLLLASCEQKPTAQVDPAQQKALQEMQARIDEISARANQLNQQLLDQKTADVTAKQAELDKLQADLEQQRRDLAEQRKAVSIPADAVTTTPASGDSGVADSTDRRPDVGSGSSSLAPATYNLFYERLQGEGAWLQTNDYGYVWQPNSARQRGWKPYTDGHWVETNQGWTWVSNESFGWATYHYGRWIQIADFGWCWLPGTEWAPAWVSWRNNDHYVGWAPLPPEARLIEGGPGLDPSVDVEYGTGPDYYNFVPVEDFGEANYVEYVVPPVQNVTIISETTNVTNVFYQNTQINNYGPAFDDIRRRSRRPVDQYALNLNRNRDSRDDQLALHGKILTVLAPFIQKGPERNGHAVQSPKIEKNIGTPIREKGWKNYNPEQVTQARENLQKQAVAARNNPRKSNANSDQAAHDQRPVATPAVLPAGGNSSSVVVATPTPVNRANDQKATADAAKARLQDHRNAHNDQPASVTGVNPVVTPVEQQHPAIKTLPPGNKASQTDTQSAAREVLRQKIQEKAQAIAPTAVKTPPDTRAADADRTKAAAAAASREAAQQKARALEAQQQTARAAQQVARQQQQQADKEAAQQLQRQAAQDARRQAAQQAAQQQQQAAQAAQQESRRQAAQQATQAQRQQAAQDQQQAERRQAAAKQQQQQQQQQQQHKKSGPAPTPSVVPGN